MFFGMFQNRLNVVAAGLIFSSVTFAQGEKVSLTDSKACSVTLSSNNANKAWYPKYHKKLQFKSDGTFKIVQFTDTQDDQEIDPRTVTLIETVCDLEKPDLVVFTGDNITSGPQTPEDVKKAINNFCAPVDSRHIPWFITFGNHDEDHTAKTKLNEDDMLSIYMSYQWNINKKSSKFINGTGNLHNLVYSYDGKKPLLNVWGLDAGRYAPDSISGQSLKGYPKWDWIKTDQILWYSLTSRMLEEQYGRKIPSLMFFHIPLWEFKTMCENRDRYNVIGERNEDECPGSFNSGLFAALLDRNDVKGVFVGHDHVNNYVGNYYGIYLGYSANTGFGTYGLDGEEKDRMRGARVFVVNESTPEKFETFMVYAKDYGIQ